MILIVALLHLFAFACFVAAAIGVPSRVNLIAAGLALWMFSLLITRV